MPSAALEPRGTESLWHPQTTYVDRDSDPASAGPELAWKDQGFQVGRGVRGTAGRCVNTDASPRSSASCSWVSTWSPFSSYSSLPAGRPPGSPERAGRLSLLTLPNACCTCGSPARGAWRRPMGTSPAAAAASRSRSRQKQGGWDLICCVFMKRLKNAHKKCSSIASSTNKNV